MISFAVIAEGLTDQIVIENILFGLFQGSETEPVVNYIQPLPGAGAHAGWSQVFKSLQERRDHIGALQINDYLVIHIDTDVQEEPGFDVPRRRGDQELSIEQRVSGVIERLQKEMDPEFLTAYSRRLLFAIAVDSIECWLLPLLINDGQKAAKTTGCFAAANDALRKENRDGLGTEKSKYPRAYEAASMDFSKRKVLIKHHQENPSLEIFVKRLLDLEIGAWT